MEVGVAHLPNYRVVISGCGVTVDRKLYKQGDCPNLWHYLWWNSYDGIGDVTMGKDPTTGEWLLIWDGNVSGSAVTCDPNPGHCFFVWTAPRSACPPETNSWSFVGKYGCHLASPAAPTPTITTAEPSP